MTLIDNTSVGQTHCGCEPLQHDVNQTQVLCLTSRLHRASFWKSPIRDLAVGSALLDFGEPMLDPVMTTTHVEHVRHVGGRGAIERTQWEGELDATIRQDSMDFVGHSRDPCDERGGR